MLLNAYCLLDSKVGIYGLPFFVQHDAQAFRMVYEACMDERSSVSKYAADFVLYRIGAYDDGVGSFANHAPTNLGSCASIFARFMRDVTPATQTENTEA